MPRSQEIGVKPRPGRRKVWIIFAAAVFVALGAIFAVGDWVRPPAGRSGEHTPADGMATRVVPEEIAAAVASSLGLEAGQDSDGDGLKDWEETIYGTDPENPDTDGDGMPDGEELRLNRNPLKPGPEDEAGKLPFPTGTPDSAEENVTFALTKNLLESGVLGAINAQDKIASTDFLDNLALPGNLARTIALDAEEIAPSDLPTTADNSTARVQNYFDALLAAYRKRLGPHRSDFVILAEAIERENYAGLAELDAVVGELDAIVREMKALPVPTDWRKEAAAELNLILKTKRAMEIFRNTDRDPLATLLIVKPRLNLLLEMIKFHAELKEKLSEIGVSFPIE